MLPRSSIYSRIPLAVVGFCLDYNFELINVNHLEVSSLDQVQFVFKTKGCNMVILIILAKSMNSTHY